MKQYCRYCAYCIEGDGFFCLNRDCAYMDEKDIKRVNHCKDFEMSDLGDIITGKQYQPRKKKAEVDLLQIYLDITGG